MFVATETYVHTQCLFACIAESEVVQLLPARTLYVISVMHIHTFLEGYCVKVKVSFNSTV